MTPTIMFIITSDISKVDKIIYVFVHIFIFPRNVPRYLYPVFGFRFCRASKARNSNIDKKTSE